MALDNNTAMLCGGLNQLFFHAWLPQICVDTLCLSSVAVARRHDIN